VGSTFSIAVMAEHQLLAAASRGRGLGLATLVTWVLTASIGGYMLSTLITSGALREQRANRAGLPPTVLIGHFSLALTGLAVWIAALATGLAWLAWTAVGVLMPAIGLGLSTVTLWTPFPRHEDVAIVDPPGAPVVEPRSGRLTDEALASALTDSIRTGKLIDYLIAGLLAEPQQEKTKARTRVSALIPVGHGIGALTTFLLAVLSAVRMS
jgi:hypothetical protein